MITGLTILTALVCLLLMGAVLIQNPKGGGIDSTFGGSQANQMFGASKQTDFIEKVTWYLAIALFALCIITSMVVDSTADAGSLIPQ
jgi:preprotein translocase subunit SecG